MVSYTIFCRSLTIKMKLDLSIVVIEQPSSGCKALILIIERSFKACKAVTFQPKSSGLGIRRTQSFPPARSARHASNCQNVISRKKSGNVPILQTGDKRYNPQPRPDDPGYYVIALQALHSRSVIKRQQIEIRYFFS